MVLKLYRSFGEDSIRFVRSISLPSIVQYSRLVCGEKDVFGVAGVIQSMIMNVVGVLHDNVVGVLHDVALWCIQYW